MPEGLLLKTLLFVPKDPGHSQQRHRYAPGPSKLINNLCRVLTGKYMKPEAVSRCAGAESLGAPETRSRAWEMGAERSRGPWAKPPG